MTTFASLFERASDYVVDEDDVREALDAHRESVSRSSANAEADEPSGTFDRSNEEPSPARVAADADVLAADLLVGGTAREALDHLRRHSWTTLVASDALIDDAEAVIATLSDAEIAGDWRGRVEQWREPVAQPAGDHPALASAYRGGAMQVVSLDASLTGAGAGAGLRDRFPVSVREPAAFATVFSPARLYPEVVGGEYPGPDRDPRE